MVTGIILAISWPEIVKLLSDSKKQIRLILPSIHSEWVDLLEGSKKIGVDIKVCLNNSEKYIRDGFGDDKAIQKLIALGIQVNEAHNNRISLISVDNTHYLYFSTSRIFENNIDEGILNAIEIDQITGSIILSSFFPQDLPSLTSSLSQNNSMLIERSSDRLENFIEQLRLNKTTKFGKNLDVEILKKISQNLKKNPPIEPDLKRAIEIYNLKVQFVELKFENGKITSRRVSIPKKALPFENPELIRILDAGMKIFEQENENKKKTFESYSSIQKDVKILRDKFLISIKCRSEKSILFMEEKPTFIKKIEAINKKIFDAKSKLINDIDIEIEKSKDRLGKELYQFFLKNPPKEIKDNYSSERIPSKCSDYVYRIIEKMRFPEPHKMVEGMKLNSRFYDLTWNDFSDKELLSEFEEKGILKDDLDSIRQLRSAFEVRK
jgi:hypothetical protein